MMKKRSFVLMFVVVLLLVVGGAAWAATHPKDKTAPAVGSGDSAISFDKQSSDSTPLPTPGQSYSDQDVAATIKSTSQDETLKTGNFTVLSIKRPINNWYIADLSPAGGGDNVTVILKSTGNSLKIVSGPGTAFDANEMATQQVPAAVQDQLVIVGDD